MADGFVFCAKRARPSDPAGHHADQGVDSAERTGVLGLEFGADNYRKPVESEGTAARVRQCAPLAVGAPQTREIVEPPENWYCGLLIDLTRRGLFRAPDGVEIRLTAR